MQRWLVEAVNTRYWCQMKAERSPAAAGVSFAPVTIYSAAASAVSKDSRSRKTRSCVDFKNGLQFNRVTLATQTTLLSVYLNFTLISQRQLLILNGVESTQILTRTFG